MEDATNSRPDLQHVAQLQHATSQRAKRAARHWMIACGAWCASTTLLAGILNQWVSNRWVWTAALSVLLFVILMVLLRLEDLAPVRAKPSRRTVGVAAAVSMAGALVLAPFTNGGFDSSVASAVFVFATFSAIGWWTSR